MSVRGEFRRLVGDTAEALRGGSAETAELADALLRARDAAREDLTGAAARVLELWDDGVDPAALPEASRQRLDASAERMLAVSRVILGE